MKNILLLSYYDYGGAGTFNLKICETFINLGYQVQMLVLDKKSNSDFVIQIPVEKKQANFFDRLINRLKRKIQNVFKSDSKYDSRYYFYNEDESKSFITQEILEKYITIKPDIIIGSWTSNFINFETLGQLSNKYSSLVFVLMADMAPLTGGCHYSLDCDGYKVDCSNCPAILDPNNKNRASHNLLLRRKAVEKYGIRSIAVSGESLSQLQSSFLFSDQKPTPFINGIIDTNIFNFKKRDIAKRVFDIPDDAIVIAAGANSISDPRKGFKELNESFLYLNEKLIEADKVVYFHLLGTEDCFNWDFSNIHVIKTATINNLLFLTLFYQAADLYISPSLADTGPVMVSQALFSGTPVIGFEVGFVNDFVVNGINGYKVKNFDSIELSNKIFSLLFEENFKHDAKLISTSLGNSFLPVHLNDFVQDVLMKSDVK